MAGYLRDCNGLIHVLDLSSAGSEFTVCGFAFDYDEEGFEGNSMVQCKGPATCAECKDAVAKMRETVRGVRFRKKLASVNNRPNG